MVQLVDGDIKTREVLDWKGVHVLHFMGSSCSQKLRIFLNLKGIEWQSHIVDLFANENFRPWFLGINPRGLVPVLVHDGAVHIESNDIITYLEKTFPTPKLIPAGHENEVAALLQHEDDLHLDLRTLSFRFVFDPPGPPKPAEALASYAANGSGTVQGAAGSRQADPDRVLAARREGGLHRRRRRGRRRRNSASSSTPSSNGWRSSPICWAKRSACSTSPGSSTPTGSALGGYPIARLHPRVGAWFGKLAGAPGIRQGGRRCRRRPRSASKPPAAPTPRPASRWRWWPVFSKIRHGRGVWPGDRVALVR